MTPAAERTPATNRPLWAAAVWFSALVAVCYAPVISLLVRQWYNDEDMGHGFFVPVLAGYIAWQKRAELSRLKLSPNWWGLVLVCYAALQLYIATLGAELFLARTALVLTVIGIVLLLCGTAWLRTLAFPLGLLFFMVPIPTIIYNNITFPLQLLASRVAAQVLALVQIPVLRSGNVLELPRQTLSVVDACSGIRSLLSLTFLALIYGYFFERKKWIRVVLFFSTVPIAIVANAGRVTLSGVLGEINPELAEGIFHLASGWVIFMVALAILIAFHHLLNWTCRISHGRS